MKHHTPVRKISTNRRSSRGYYSFRGEDCVAHESTVERDFVMRMEFERDVDKLVSQPIELSYIDLNGRRQRYTPDYLVYFKSNRKPLLVEVKEKTELVEKFDKLRPKFSAAFAAAKEEGWIFKIYDERRIRGALLDNIRKLNNYAAHSVRDDDQANLLTALLEQTFPLTVNSFLESYTSSRQEYLQAIGRVWWLATNHRITIDLTKPLSEETYILGVTSND